MKLLTPLRTAYYRFLTALLLRRREKLVREHGPRLMADFYQQTRRELINEGQDPQLVDQTITLHQEISEGKHARLLGDVYAHHTLGIRPWSEIVYGNQPAHRSAADGSPPLVH